MTNFIRSSLSVLSEALTSPCSSSTKSNIPPAMEKLSSTSESYDESMKETSQEKLELSDGNRLSVKIKDPRGRCVDLENQLESVHRAIVEPLEREIARLKSDRADGKEPFEIQELEIVLLPALSELSDHGPLCEEGDLSLEPEKSIPNPLVDQSLRRQTEFELASMRESLEVRKEWRSFYAFHLERFRQLHAAVVQQYHDKLVEVDEKSKETQEELRIARQDLSHNRRLVGNCSKDVVRARMENKLLEKELTCYKEESSKLLRKMEKDHKVKTCNLETDLKLALEDIAELECQIAKLQPLIRDTKSSNRLNMLLNDKLRKKTKEATDLFAENIKLRERGVVLRYEMTATSQKNKELSRAVQALESENKTLKASVQQLENRISPNGEDLLLKTESLQIRVQELEVQVETQQGELERSHLDLAEYEQEIRQLKAGKEFENHVNEGLCETLEAALQDTRDVNTTLIKELHCLRYDYEDLKQLYETVAHDFETEKEIYALRVETLEDQLAESISIRALQNEDLTKINSELLTYCTAVDDSSLHLDKECVQIAEDTTCLQEVLERGDIQSDQLHLMERKNEELEEKNAQLESDNSFLHQELDTLRQELKSQSEDANVTREKHSMELSHMELALQETQELNNNLSRKVQEQTVEIENLCKESLQARNDLESHREEVVQKLALKDGELINLRNTNESLLVERDSLSRTIETERKNNSEQLDDLKIQLGDLQIDNHLLEYEISQLKAHLESVLEENAQMYDKAFDDESDIPCRMQDEIEESIGHASFDFENDSIFQKSDPTPLLHMMHVKPLSQHDLEDGINAAFEQLDDTVRNNHALLTEVSEAGLTPNWKARSPLNSLECGKELISNDASQSKHPTLLLTSEKSMQLQELASPVLHVDDYVTLDSDSMSDNGILEVQLKIKSPASYSTLGGNEDQVSLPLQIKMNQNSWNDELLDEVQSPQSDLRESSEWQASSSVTKTSMVLADHLMAVLEGHEGSDEAVLEDMDRLRVLLLQDEVLHQNEVLSRDGEFPCHFDDREQQQFKREMTEQLVFGEEEFHDCHDDAYDHSMEVTLDEFFSRQVSEKEFQDACDHLVDEWVDRVKNEFFDINNFPQLHDCVSINAALNKDLVEDDERVDKDLLLQENRDTNDEKDEDTTVLSHLHDPEGEFDDSNPLMIVEWSKRKENKENDFQLIVHTISSMGTMTSSSHASIFNNAISYDLD